MNRNTDKKLPTAATMQKPRRARVRLKKVDCNTAIACSPLEEPRAEWWVRLKAALGTCSSEFAYVTLQQLVAVCRLPGSAISEAGVNAAIALIEGAKPRDEIEAALIVQMACTHSATMCVLARSKDYLGERTIAAGASAASRMLRAYPMQLEALRRYRSGGSQTIRIEHVDINEGGQAVIGTITNG